MSAAPPPQGRSFLLTDCLLYLGAIVGAVSGPVWGYMNYGILGAIVGLPVGFILGGIGSFVLMIVVFLTVLPIAILCTEGPRGLWVFLCGKWEGPDNRPSPPTEPPTDTTSSVG